MEDFDPEFKKKYIREPRYEKSEQEKAYLEKVKKERDDKAKQEYEEYKVENTSFEGLYQKPKKKKLSAKEQQLFEETEKNKKAVVSQLKKTPLVQFACEKTGVGRSTYYKWRVHDSIFARAADRAIESGRFFINDLAESKLMNKIQKDDSQAIMFWLRHNHPNYATKHHFVTPFELVSKRSSIEEDVAWSEQISGIVNWKNKPNFKTEDVKGYLEHELKKAEYNQEDTERLNAFLDDEEKA